MRSLFPSQQAIRAEAIKVARELQELSRGVPPRVRAPDGELLTAVKLRAVQLGMQWRQNWATDCIEQLFQMDGRYRGKQRNEILNHLYCIATWALRRIEDLQSAGVGLRTALLRLLADQAVDAFHRALGSATEFDRRDFARCVRIPGYITVDADEARSNRDLAEVLRLGTETGRNFTGKQASRRSGPTAAVIHVYELLKNPVGLHWRVKKRFPNGDPDPFVRSGDTILKEAFQSAACLPPLTRNTAPDWCKVAWPVFYRAYGKNFEDCPLFRAQAKSGEEKAAQRARRGDPMSQAEQRGAIRKLIKRQIQLAWRSIAARDSGG